MSPAIAIHERTLLTAPQWQALAADLMSSLRLHVVGRTIISNHRRGGDVLRQNERNGRKALETDASIVAPIADGLEGKLHASKQFLLECLEEWRKHEDLEEFNATELYDQFCGTLRDLKTSAAKSEELVIEDCDPSHAEELKTFLRRAKPWLE